MKFQHLIAGIVLGSAVVLVTGCHTVAGTVEGAATGVSQDVHAVTEPMPVHHTYEHRMMHKKHKHHPVKHSTTTKTTKSTTTTTSSANQVQEGAAPAETQTQNQVQ